MKFDKQVFNLSIEAYNTVESKKNDTNEEVKIKQDKLLKILLTKFREQLKSKEDNGDGILKVIFESRFCSDFNDGYREINELVKSNNFDSFASEYCMYIGDIEYRCDEWYSAYYEIIWDYKTYFEQLRESKEGKETIRAINYSQKYAKINAKRELCKQNGHEWGPWKEIMGTKTITDGPREPSEMHLYKEVSYQIQVPKWQRKCNVCGCTGTVETKPEEVETKELRELIKTLQRK